MVSSQTRLAVFGVALHALLIYAMFDVHFITPLVHGMEPTTADFAAPASRLVVIVADGLRADRLFELEDAPGDDPDAPRVPRAPFLHGVAESRGRWGISHARPPTESRPGHVALLAGFYEDPSAITKGWQANAVEFDHLLNQSSAAWAIGAPSVVPLFAKGIEHVRHRMYAEELEDFAASNDHAALDEWVFDRTIEILDGHVSAEDEANGATRDSEREALEGERVVFLLHLLGLDSAGHAHKPFGDAYAKNVKTVDDGVRRLVAAFERRFAGEDDGGTTFLFTADHGMSSRGAHGDGDPGCTETPFVAWGAGIPAAADAAADNACASRGKDAPTPREAWGLEDAARCDVDQADVASLGASVLGMPPPTHNAGSLPVSYLDPAMPSARSGAALANAEQLLAVYRRKAAVAARASLTAFLTPGGLRPYAPLAGAGETLAAAKRARGEGDHDAAVDAAQALARACMDGATYLHLYDRRLLLWTIASCFLGWIGVLFAELATGSDRKREVTRKKETRATAVAAGVSCAACAVLASRRAPATYYAYFTLPAWFARRAFLAFASAAEAGTERFYKRREAVELLATAVAATALARTLCAAFHDRRVFSYLFAATAAALVAYAARAATAKRRRARGVARAAAVSALFAAAGAGALAPFTLLSIDLEANTALVVAGVACTALVGLLSHFALRPLDVFGDDPEDADADAAGGARRPGYKLLVVQLSLLWCAGLVVWMVDGLQGAKASIPAWLHACAWAIAAGAMPLPLLSPPRVVPRFASVYLAAATAYALFSVSYESLFYAALGFASLAWLVLERHVQKLAAADALFDGDKTRLGSRVAESNADAAVTFATSSVERDADKSVARHAATFLALINAAFFGTGNIASVASFEISSVYRFTTRFNPFLMGALLMLKVLVPMITVAVAFLCLLKLRATPPFPAYLVFIALSDLMSVTFFFEVTTEGSWQDIGMSISRYALMGTQVVTILVFLGLADAYAAAIPTRGVVARRAGNDAGKKTR